MIELQGKYNTAKVFTNNIDSETISQIINLLNQEFINTNYARLSCRGRMCYWHNYDDSR